MKNILILILFFTLNSCNGQNKNEKKEKSPNNLEEGITSKKIMIMEKFDIKRFEENKGKQDYDSEYHYKLANNSDVREFATTISSNNNEILYQREVTMEFSPLKQVFIYFDNGNIYSRGTFFNNRHVGVYKVFDKKGKIVEEINDDKNFKHTFEQIHDKLLKEKKIDIYDTRQAIALRHDGSIEDNIKPYYQIHVLKSNKVEGVWYSNPDYSLIIDDETLKEVSSKDNNSK